MRIRAMMILWFFAISTPCVPHALSGKKSSRPPTTKAGTAKDNPKDGLKYVWIPPGSFMMGCSPGNSGCLDEEYPAHRVTLSKGFWMGQSEVTVGAYKRFSREAGKAMPEEPKLSSTALNPGWGNERMPIVNVNWEDAKAFCGWAGGRLPTEAEWEYAARAGSTAARYGPLDDIAWYDKNSGGKAHDVGQKCANAFNLFDMLGNVFEWVSDWFGPKYYEGSPERDPTGATSGQSRVHRGGAWYFGDMYSRVSLRTRNRPGYRGIALGVRCAREVIP